MTALRFIVALTIAAVLLYIARTNSEGRPEFISQSEGGFTFEITTLPKALEGTKAKITVVIRGDMISESKLLLRHARAGESRVSDIRRYRTTPLLVEDSAAGIYFAMVPTGTKNGRFYYYFEIRDQVGGYRARFMGPDGEPFQLRFIGEVPRPVLIGHVAFMVLSVFFTALGLLYALPIVSGGGKVRPMAVSFLLAAVCVFVGGYPIGWLTNHYAFGTLWEGVPFGTDATDNKTQLLFLGLLFVAATNLGSLTGSRFARDLYPIGVRGWFGVGVFALMLGIYLVPHSIQFSPGLTYAICYSVIAVFVLIYLLGMFRYRQVPHRVKPAQTEPESQ
ncbi:MAG: hypothetical protein AB1744_05165 [Candidatus Zixiibacteriota bacterium]